MTSHGIRAALQARARHSAQQTGYAAILMALLVAGILFPIASFAVDVARWYVEGERVQAAADAAALGGVTYLPEYYSNAQSEALKVSGENGYPNSGTSTVTVSLGAKPTQLKVTVTSRVHNSIAASWGDDYTVISRTAVADYNGPAPMGSPCNTFGNEPPGTSGAGPSGSVLSVPDADAKCSTTPMFWTAIAGPDTPKGNGDEIMTRTCSAGNDGCTSGKNDEFDPKGYFYVVRATPAAVGHTVTLQLYDAAWAEVGDNCDQAPSGTISSNNWNDYATTDAQTRYAKTAGTYCPGDVLNGSGRVTTTFGVRSPTVTQYPPNGTPITGCAKQFPGYVKADVTANALRKGNAAYNAGLARTFRQWTDLCSFTVTKAGDYYLQVRTNVATGQHDPELGEVLRARLHGRVDRFDRQQGVHADWRRHLRRRSGQQPLRHPDRQRAVRLDVGRGVAGDVDLHELHGSNRAVQPGPRHSRRCHQVPDLELLRRR